MSNMKSIFDTYNNLIVQDETTTKTSSDVQLRFTPNLASEFTNTINLFTSICAKMVKSQNVSKDLYDKYDEVYTKIKNLTDAAKNSSSQK